MKTYYPQNGLAVICGLFGVSRQAFYQYQRQALRTGLEEEIALELSLSVRQRHPRMGVRKVYAMVAPELAANGIKMGRDALFGLFSRNGLLLRRRKRKVATTQSHHWLLKYPNLVTGWELERPNQVWVADITYVRTAEGFLYLSLLTDAYSKMVLGHCLAETLEAGHSREALEMALKGCTDKNALPGLVHHSDRGVQYCSYGYTDLLKKNQVAISMGEKGDPLENPVAERVNGIVKEEYLFRSENMTKEQVGGQLGRAIWLYNHERPHLSCDMLTPAQAHQANGKLKRRWKNYYQGHRPEKQEAAGQEMAGQEIL